MKVLETVSLIQKYLEHSLLTAESILKITKNNCVLFFGPVCTFCEIKKPPSINSRGWFYYRVILACAKPTDESYTGPIQLSHQTIHFYGFDYKEDIATMLLSTHSFVP